MKRNSGTFSTSPTLSTNDKIVQLTLEQHWFELHSSTYMWIFKNKNTVGPLYPWVSTTHRLKTVFLICGLESVGAEHQPYALPYPILYEELEHLRSWGRGM